MKVSQNNLIDTISYYMQDNDLQYLHVRASKGVNGSIKMVIFDDIEFED